jgi:hypothetical protein
MTMDSSSYAAVMKNCRQVAGFLGTVDFDELDRCARHLNAGAGDRLLIDVLGDAARRLPKAHP